MNAPAVLVLTEYASDILPLLQELTDEGVRIRAAASPAEALAAYSGQEVLLGQPDLVAEVLPSMPAVRWVQSTWAGVTPVLEAGRGRRNFVLTGIKDVFGPQMAEFVFGYLLARELRIAERSDRQRRREWWDVLSGHLHGKTLGIMGTGSIGAHIARVAQVFGLRVIGLSRSGAEAHGFERVYPTAKLHAFLAEPDYLVGVLPDTPGTTRLLDAAAFRAMKPGCYLVNVGRGNLVDENALAEALMQGRIAGAVLDVFAEEPLPKGSPLWDLPGLTITAHIAAVSRPVDIAAVFLDNYRRYQAHQPMQYVVDFGRGY